MPTERATRAAEALFATHNEREFCVEKHTEDGLYDGHATEDEVADLIDRAAGLPELEARVAELEREKQEVLESTIPTGGDYVCSECCVQKHDECDRDECDCIACLKRERDALAKRVAELKRDAGIVVIGDGLRVGKHWIENVQAERDALAKRLEALAPVLDFLDGSKSLEGRWFGESYAGIPQHWWRKYLRLARGES